VRMQQARQQAMVQAGMAAQKLQAQQQAASRPPQRAKREE
jgi:hypothetical protein